MSVSDVARDAALRHPLLLPDDAAVAGAQLLQRLRDGLDGGAPWVGIETDGTRLARDHGFALALSRLDARVHLRVAGSSERVHLAVHGRDLRRVQRRALDGCAGVGLTVALVMMVVDGLNDGELGDVALLGLEHPAVRAVVFQCGTRLRPIPHADFAPSPVGVDELVHRLVLQLPRLLRVDHFSGDNGHRVACLLSDGEDIVSVSPPPAAVQQAARHAGWLASGARPSGSGVTAGTPGSTGSVASLTVPAAHTFTVVIEQAHQSPEYGEARQP